MPLNPSPDLTPEQVVKIQLTAMEHNDDPTPDAGLATTFHFASPGNQKQTGPLEKFIKMVKSDAYGPLINHKSAELGKTHTDDHTTQILVKITGSDNHVSLFLFVLSKQPDGQYKDCWMTDGVMRIRPEDIVPLQPTPPPGNNGNGNGEKA
jgi:hypothetical protein